MMKVYRTSKGQGYVLTRHARIRMMQRSISQDQVEYVIDNDNKPYINRHGDKCYEGYLEDGRKLRVVIADKNNRSTVITTIVL
jgi:hypothetical protein